MDKINNLLEILKIKALSYKINMELLEITCKYNPNYPNATFLCNNASKCIKTYSNLNGLLRESISAGKSLVEMEEVINELILEGYPLYLSLDICKDILYNT